MAKVQIGGKDITKPNYIHVKINSIIITGTLDNIPKVHFYIPLMFHVIDETILLKLLRIGVALDRISSTHFRTQK
jgi:hypothetical protein